MKKLIMVICLAAASGKALAGLSSGSISPLIVVAAPEPRTVAVVLSMPADFVSIPIRIISDQKNTAAAYEETQQAIELISKKVKEQNDFRISQGVVFLSQHRSSFGISAGYSSVPAATAEVYLLVPLTKKRDNIFAAGAEGARFLSSLQLQGKTRCELGQLLLAVENPEQFRAKLLGLIDEEVKKTRDAVATNGSVRIDGLQSSVMVRQADDRDVELFLSYTVSITSGR
jgi:hypothetical protein